MPEESSQDPQSLLPAVSILIAGLNQVEATRRAIRACVATQERDRSEIIVADYGSKDGGAFLDAEFSTITMLRLPHHIGWTRAMNIASRTAKAELLLMISPDVELGPTVIPSLISVLEASPEAAAACPLLVDPTGKPVPQAMKLPDANSMKLACRGELPASAASTAEALSSVEYPRRDAMMLRKQFLRGINNFDERFGEFWADADLAFQIRRANKKIYIATGARATLHSGEDPLKENALAEADRAAGAAAYVGKHFGAGSGLSFRLSVGLGALVRFDFGTLGALFGGNKLDGKQVN